MRATQWMEEDEGIAYISIFTECVFYTFTFRNSIDYCCAQLDSSVPIRIVCPMPFLISAKSLQLNVRLFIRRRWFHSVRNHLKLHTSVRLDSNRGVSTELWQKTADHPSSRNCLFFCFVLSISFIHRHAMPCHSIRFISFSCAFITVLVTIRSFILPSVVVVWRNCVAFHLVVLLSNWLLFDWCAHNSYITSGRQSVEQEDR